MTTDSPRIAIVTGAGSGIGEAIAHKLAAESARVVLAGRRAELLQQVADAIVSGGGVAVAHQVDLSDPDGPAELVDAARAHFGGLDVIVNNAAIIHTHPLAEFTVAEFDDQVATNVRAPSLLVQQALPELRESANASVVNISSSSGTIVRPEQSVYGMTKAALEYLTKAFAAELAADRIRVNCIAPGPVDTPLHETWAESREAAWEWMMPQIPLARMGDSEEIATWVSWLCDSRATWVTGAVIPVDGGQALDFR